MLRPSDSTLLRSQLRIRRLHPLLELGEQRTRVAGVLSIHPQTETALREAAEGGDVGLCAIGEDHHDIKNAAPDARERRTVSIVLRLRYVAATLRTYLC